MIDTRENAQAVVDLLRSMYAADPQATQALLAHRVACNESLAFHPSVIVRAWDDPFRPSEGAMRGDFDVGFLGVVNALFGPKHRVASIVDAITGELTAEAFTVVDVSGPPPSSDAPIPSRL